MKISIIIPIYKVAKEYLIECLNSAVNQTYKNIEVITVLDGANSDILSICKNYSKKYNNLRMIEQPNLGVSASRNNGIKIASGEWIMFLDADDWLELDCCEYISNIIEKTDIDILLFNHIKDWSNKSLKINHDLIPDFIYDTSNVWVKEMLYLRAMNNPNTKNKKNSVIYYSVDKVYSKKFLIDNNIQYPIDLPKSEDKVFILNCLKKMNKLYYSDKYFYHYRQNNQSMCKSYFEKADTVRYILAEYLKKIALEMDEELSRLKNIPDYSKVTEAYNYFLFGILSDVLLQKYYHKDYPHNHKNRFRSAYNFIHSEPFHNAILSVNYGNLPFNAKIKKFLLSHNLISLFCFLKRKRITTTNY